MLEHKIEHLIKQIDLMSQRQEIMFNQMLKTNVKLDLLNTQNKKIMSAEQDVLDAIAAEKAKLDAFKTDLEAFIAAHSTPDGGISAEGVQKIKDAIAGNSAAVDAVDSEVKA